MGKMTLNEAMKYIITQKGKSCLADPKLLNALLTDLVENDAKIVHFIVQASSNHHFDFMAGCRDNQIRNALEKISENMKDDYAEGVTEKIVSSLYYAFSLTPPRKPEPVVPVITAPEPMVSNTPAPQQVIPPQKPNSPSGNFAGKIIASIALVVVIAIFAVSRISAGRSDRGSGSAVSETETPSVTETASAAEASEPVTVAEKEEPEETAEPEEPEFRMGTVYIAPGAEPPRIIVRTEPRKADDTKTDKRKVNGDRVKVYETKQGSKYTWYRIGEREWIAGNGTSFYVKFD